MTNNRSPLSDDNASSGGFDIELDGNEKIPSLDIAPDPELTEQGWERRFMGDSARVEEATSLYSELGYEVRTEPVMASELSEVCGDCGEVACKSFVTIYTRKAGVEGEG